jgi:hypothetical protein
MNDQVPPRIHVLVARQAPFAVVIRRGPSKQVCTIGWNLKTDEFKLGQWFKGRIYERSSDLSPDGQFLIYMATKGRHSADVGWQWTAISRAPYLKAIGLWGIQLPVDGGGLFGNDREYWISCFDQHKKVRAPNRLNRIDTPPLLAELMVESPGVYYPRLLRDGWAANENLAPRREWFRRARVAVFERPVDDFWILRKFARSTMDHPVGKGCYYDEHELEDRSTGTTVDAKNWDWADVVNQRLLWSRNGAIFTGRLTPNGIADERMLYDFNGMNFESVVAPN